MAVVGPLTSIVLGALFIWIAASRIPTPGIMTSPPSAALGRLDALSTMLAWLGPLNILIGLFNLIPAFPLDGGRILRSIIWAASNDLRRATRWATGIGQAFGWLLILLGVAMAFGTTLPILGSGLINGLWFAFIGWFLINAAAQSYQQVLIDDLLEGVPVTLLMRENAPGVSPDTSVSTLVYDYLMRGEDRAFPVVVDRHLLGMVYAEDLRRTDRSAWDTTKAQDVMTPEAGTSKS